MYLGHTSSSPPYRLKPPPNPLFLNNYTTYELQHKTRVTMRLQRPHSALLAYDV